MRCYVGGLQRFSTEDGPGIRTTVFLKGCPLRCVWCHNPELISPEFRLMYRKNTCIGCGSCIETCEKKAISYNGEDMTVDYKKCNQCLACVKACCSGSLYTKANYMTAEEVIKEVEKDMDFYRNSNGGVTLSGGEVLSHREFAYTIAKKCREKGISVAIDTSGFGQYEDLHKLASLSDVILYDLKHMDREAHKKYTGQHPDLIWNNLIRLSKEDSLRKKVIIRVPLISGVNDTEENIRTLCGFMKAYRFEEINLLPYHNMGISKGKRVGISQKEYEAPSDETLMAIRNYFINNDIKAIVMGKES